MATNPTLTQFPAGETTYKINFDYLARQFVVLTLVNSADLSQNRELVANVDYRFLNETTVSVMADQTGFDIMRIHRYTSSERLVDFRDGSTLTASDLTIAELQAIHIAEEGREYTLTLANEAVEKAQAAAGEAENAAQRAEDAAESINNSIVPGGADVIGTRHRGRLNIDLDAIDRRPDGYGDSIQNVFTTGMDVTLNKDLTIDSPIILTDDQIINYAGGKLTNTFKGVAVAGTGVKGVRINGLRLSGLIENAVSTGGNVGYAVNFTDSSNLKISDINTEKYTGSVLLTNCSDSVIRDVYSRANRYHINVAAGGYGVLLQGGRRILVDGINFEADATKGDLGRHALYISVNKQDLGNYCQDIIVRGIISRKNGLNNRAMWDAVIRKSNNVLITDFDCQGSNGGFSVFAEDGPVDNLHITNGTMLIRQYDNNAVYAFDISGGPNGMNYCVGALVDGVTIKLEYDPDTVTDLRMVAFNVLARNSRFSNAIIRAPGPTTPIVVNGGIYLQFSDIQDFVSNDGTGLNYLFRFTAPTSEVTVKNIQTRRPLFAGLEYVTNMTVDYQRKVEVINTAGTLSSTDPHTVVESITFSGANVSVKFRTHVTQTAIDNLMVEPTTANTSLVVVGRGNRTLLVRVANLSGAVRPITDSYGFNIMLNS